jgi:DNA-binding HxlR family transcriptional regulator
MAEDIDLRELFDIAEYLQRTGAKELLLCLEQPKRFTDVLRELNLTGSTLSRRMHEFVQKGLITTEYDPIKKIINYKLTEKGQKYLRILTTLMSTPERTFAVKLARSKSYEEGINVIIDDIVKEVNRDLKLNISEEEIRKIAELIIKHYRTRLMTL